MQSAIAADTATVLRPSPRLTDNSAVPIAATNRPGSDGLASSGATGRWSDRGVRWPQLARASPGGRSSAQRPRSSPGSTSMPTRDSSPGRSAALISALRAAGRWPPVVPAVVRIECLTGDGPRDAAQHRFLRTCDIAETVPLALARRARLATRPGTHRIGRRRPRHSGCRARWNRYDRRPRRSSGSRRACVGRGHRGRLRFKNSCAAGALPGRRAVAGGLVPQWSGAGSTSADPAPSAPTRRAWASGPGGDFACQDHRDAGR